MAEKVSGDKAGEKSFFARTAKNTTKRAKRAQEKVKRKLGKTEETKDEIFDRFVENFNKQQDAVQRLQKELKNYINCLKAMLNANQLFGEAVKQVYEPEWSGREKFVQLLDTLDHNWTNLVQQLQDEVLEPLTSYQIQFPDTKNRISKRSRKVVDYDRHRHHLETLKGKGGKTGDPKKISQAEEDYNQAKNAYLQLHSDLYEELPALYDSRISIYVSSFQSIFTAEGVFHRETAKMKTEMNDLLDVLARETSAGAYSTRRPLSIVSNDNISSDGDSTSENCAKSADGKTTKDDHSDEETSGNEEVDAGAVKLYEQSNDNVNNETEPSDNILNERRQDNVETEGDVQPTPASTSVDISSKLDTAEVDDGVPQDTSEPAAESSSLPEQEREDVQNAVEHEEKTVSHDSTKVNTHESKVNRENEKDDDEKEVDGDKIEKDSDVDLSRVLYKVEATHPYTGEDEDELTFEKGDIIEVIPYNESDDPDDGWLLGVMESTGKKGVFPENFTKKLED